MTSFAGDWLNIQCQAISNLRCALLLLVTNENEPQLAAQWPEQDNQPFELIAIAKQAISKRQTIINTVETGSSGSQLEMDYLAYPIFIKQKIVAVIAVKTSTKTAEEREKLCEALQLGAHWLALPENYQSDDDEFYATIVKLTATCFEQPYYQQCLIALVTELNSYFSCERIAFGEYANKHIKVKALSNSAQFDDKTQLIQLISDAMCEAVDQDKIIAYPNEQETTIDFAHRELLRAFGSGSVCTFPLACEGEIIGALTLDFTEKSIDSKTRRLLEMTLALISPFLKLKKSEERWLGKKIWDSIAQIPAKTLNYKHLGLKFAGLSFALLVIFSAVIDGDFRIAADAILEGKIQRTIAAPMDGFIESADVRAGDTVVKGQLMATMEDADLKLEKIRLSSLQQKLKREYREALADHDLVKIRIIAAQIEQNQAQAQLVAEKLNRTHIKAPFNGIVIEGDLSQSMGSPVERGDIFFKIAPLEGYRIILKVNEKDISHINPGQQGILILSSFPGESLDLKVEKITAIASADDGENIFRVEASVTDPPEKLRPGMEGIGKIDAGSKKLLWIWTHDLVDWVRLWLWTWLP